MDVTDDQPKVLGNGEELILKSPVSKSTPSPSSSTKKSLSLCTRRCPRTLPRETSKQAERLEVVFGYFRRLTYVWVSPQVQVNMPGQDSSLRRGLGFAG